MKNLLQVAVISALLFTFDSTLETACAQGTEFTYQGRVLDNGAAFTGTGQFEFALVTSTNNNHQATATATTSGGFVTIINVVSGGSGYTTAPAVTISGGGGNGAAATANLTSGVVTSYTVNAVGSGYTSTPTVTVAPPPANLSYTTYWSNDGTSVNGSEPSASVSVAVASGLFTVTLGNTSLANMTAIPAALFAEESALQLRIWFSDGTNGFSVLSPLQNLAPAPYAAFAASASNVLGTVSTAQLNGTISTAQLNGTISISQVTGTIPVAQLPSSVVTNGESGVNITGTFTGNGAGVTNVPLGSLNGFSWGSFQIAGTYPVGSFPQYGVAVDVNGDGKADMVCVDNSTNTLTVLTNNGFGMFGSNAVYTVGPGPVFVVTMDVNGDGSPDLICANSGTNTLTVLTNNGHGVFASYATLVTGTNPACLALADVNGDGKLDLISANYSANSLTILTNNGAGMFGSNATISVSGGPDFVAAADFNGDGKIDLAVSEYGAGGIMILTNNGFGVFGSNALLNAGQWEPDSIAVADINGDGKPDLIWGTYNYDSYYGGLGSLNIYTNNGYGVFGSNAVIAVGWGVSAVTVADVNNDGKPDLICANNENDGYYSAGPGSLVVFINNGSGGFASVVSYGLPAGWGPEFVSVADVNGDGHTDLITGFNGTNTLVVFTNTPTFPNNLLAGFSGGLNFIGGGNNNVIGPTSGLEDVIAGGANNTVNGNGCSVVGGSGNTASGTSDVVAGGQQNNSSGGDAMVGAGTGNTASGGNSFVGGGVGNVASGNGAAIVGGGNLYGAVYNGGPNGNNVASGAVSFVGGGSANAASGAGAVVCGGGYDGNFYNLNTYGNTASGEMSAIVGGFGNQASGYAAFIGGGYDNTAPGNGQVVSGGQDNNILQSSDHAVIGGGLNNNISSNDYEGTIAGGYYNAISDLYNNAAQATIGGGEYNTNSSYIGTIAGGQNNLASGQYQPTVGGGYNNTASGSYATVPGGFQNVASGVSSFAAGARGQALHQGAFVWADNSVATSFASTANNQFLVRAQGGVGINMNNPNGASLYVQGNRTNGWPNSVGIFENTSTVSNNAPALRVVVDGGNPLDGALSVSANINTGTRGIIAEFGNTSSYVVIITNDGTIYSKGVALTSDRNVKANFTKLDSQAVLAKVSAMPVTEWNYKEDSKDQRHIGPMAQDFHAAFGLNGGDDKHISVVDEGGVALAAIQGLNQKLEKENAELKAELSELKTEVRQLAQAHAKDHENSP